MSTPPTVRGMSTLVRPRFGPGMLLQHEDLEQLASYTRDLNRLLFRSLFGCGVVCGLVVKPENDCGRASIVVGAGLALNCAGDPIYVPKDQRIAINETCDPNPATPLWVLLCGTVKCCAPRPSMCASDEDEQASMCTRDREGFEIRVVSEAPKCSCRCEPPGAAAEAFDTACWCANPNLECYRKHYLGECGCNCDECAGGGCDCVLLARLDAPPDVQTPWSVSHRVRRFVRPVLIRDPQVEAERLAQQPKVMKRGGGQKNRRGSWSANAQGQAQTP